MSNLYERRNNKFFDTQGYVNADTTFSGTRECQDGHFGSSTDGPSSSHLLRDHTEECNR
jgi:hypothetical protein